jgi:hypothetical protein
MKKTFIYIHDFIFNDSVESKRFFGHPKAGKVYSADKINDFLYKVPLRSVDGVAGIVLDLKRQEEDDDPGKWDFKIAEITEDNLVDFNLSVDDLNIIHNEWVDDFKEERPKMEDINSIKITEAFDDATDALNIIVDNDQDMFFALIDVMNQIQKHRQRRA